MVMSTNLQDAIDREGFGILVGALSGEQIHAMISELETAMARPGKGPIRRSSGQVTASRNVTQLSSGVHALARSPSIRRAIVEVLGSGCGLVRALYFDKPPGRSWAL